MEQERYWILLARKLSGEASAKELKELEDLVRDNPNLGFYQQVLIDYWKAGPQEMNEGVDQVFNRIQSKITEEDTVVTPAPVGGRKSEPWKEHSKETGIIYPFKKTGMLINYLKFAWRVLFRNKAFSFINITGLAVGMASAVVLLLVVALLVGVDQFHHDKDRKYVLYSQNKHEGKLVSWDVTPMVLGPVLKANYPEVEDAVRVNWVAAFILKNGDKQIQTEGNLVDPGFLTMFNFPLIKGDPKSALNDKYSIVITQSLSKKLFGNEEAMGKVIKIDSNVLFTVTGVLRNMPENTRFSGMEYIVPWDYMKDIGWERLNWDENSNAKTYVTLKPGVSEERANELFKNIITSHASDVKTTVFVHPMKKWALWSHYENGKAVGGAIEDVRMFSIIAGIILLIACINYMNLSTARSVKRAKEVGIRKVAGAGKRSLISQFLIESILFAFLSGGIALLILGPGLRWFNDNFGTHLSVPYGNPNFWLYAIGFVLFTGMLAGSYPAFYLSAYKPIRVLKGIFKGSGALVTPRKVLVVFQFGFAITMIICTIVIYRQLAFGRDRDPGYDQKGLTFVYMKGDAREKYQLIRRDLENSGAVTNVTQTNSPITDVWAWEDSYEWKGKPAGSKIQFMKYNTDYGFAKTIGLKLVAGRDIDVHTYPADSNALLLNETAIKMMGLTNPVGQHVRSSSGNWTIVGVLKDVITGSPYHPIYPMAVEGPVAKNWSGTITFRLNPRSSTSANLEKITAVFKKHNPDYPTDYYFVDEWYSSRFSGIKSMGTLAGIFAALTILISCLGLFALATYMAESRIKEIGVRKVLGASVLRITTLLSKDFLKLIIISFIVASPVAWWLMNAWLSDYPYRVSISWWVFAATGLISVFIALITISYQAVRAAMANPVKSLRTE